MPKGQRKYKGTQKVEIIERMRREQMSFHEASRSYEIPRRTLRMNGKEVAIKNEMLTPAAMFPPNA